MATVISKKGMRLFGKGTNTTLLLSVKLASAV